MKEQVESYNPACVTDVASGSAAARCGVRAGDHLLAINGRVLRDVIDVQVYGSEQVLTMLFERNGAQHTCRVTRRYGEPLGMEFVDPLFDGPARVCRNRCEFCFVSQMAPGLRRTLYVKDDDFRLSFLHGNYVTLTNLSDADWARIADQYLSPLYVSVHATDPELRGELLHHKQAGQIMSQLQRLAEMGIEVHTQAVLLPGRNDGAQLDRTIDDLSSLYPSVADVTVVPVGLTRWHHPDLRPYTPAEAGAVLGQCLSRQTELRRQLGVGFVYPSDEWYLKAGVAVPALDQYDGLLPAMIENGVGMVRRFLDSWPNLQVRLAALGGSRQTWITGMSFGGILSQQAAAFSAQTGIAVRVVPVVNRAFGDTVTVAGLLTTADVLDALAGVDFGGLLVLPGVMFRGPEGQSLDEQTPADIAYATGRRVCIVNDSGMDEWDVTCYD